MELQSFAEHLKNISLSIDIVNDITFTRVKTEMTEYFKKLDIQFFEFLVPSIVEDSQGLNTFWHIGGKPWSKRIKDDTGKYKGQISYSFDRDMKLCIVATNNAKLSEATGYNNLWKDQNEIIKLPQYEDLSNSPTYSSIMIPVKDRSDNMLGIFNFEFGNNIEITMSLQEELELLTQAFSNLYVLNRANNTQRVNTNKVLSSLSKLSSFSVNFKKPKIFVATSGKADQNVVKSIQKVLDNYKDKVTIKYWYKSRKPGSIIREIMDDIENCTFGICYLSDCIKDGNHFHYPDNPNVIFEAGMLHGLSRLAANGPKNWIPIREADELAGKLPFDIANERILEVPRNNDKFNKKAFETELDNVLQELIKPIIKY
ncbi:TIR domain-containing protein [Dokdonia sp.]|uniref:TIR domain-containing protein n=1 Tax=Dokdonia sp. TaxID=2024995 RepID=UPI0032642770